MATYTRAAVTAVLGPTNTGKTHLAVERLVAHSSGMMGFPLRLLAREVYDRVVAIKGAHQVALVTGEEKIVPPGARWFLCTAESMPVSGGVPAGNCNIGNSGNGRAGGGLAESLADFAFVALDEAQLGTDPERGHVFTDRLLRARGREETMILGSAALTPMVRALLPEAEIVSRPRFSTLSYAGAKKLSRLPRRSAIVAFSAEEVYAVAEMLRRLRGGAAVVMGALSPSTRNAQVAMFMNGDVDYLVATDAIGMGLNLDVSHVAFAALRKFDGHRTRRLTIMEMAQIAGRAGRHHKDGSFGSLGGEGAENGFSPEEIDAIENHRFPPIEHLYWRDGEPDMGSVGALIAALEARPTVPELRAAPEATDLAVLKHMAADPLVQERVRTPHHVRRLWDVCGLPDFQKLGPDHHARLVQRLWRWRSEGRGHVPADWFAQNVARLDNVQGDIDTLSGRIAMARTWAYIAHRPDWLEHPEEMAARTRALEEKLSDALHGALTQRFVDRRTSVLLRDIGRKRSDLPLDIDADGAVHVDGEPLGRLEGFRFHVDPAARGGDRRLLLAAAERRLGKMLTVKAEELIAAPDGEFTLDATPGAMPRLLWKDEAVAGLHAGPTLLTPEIRVDKAIMALGQDVQNRVSVRLHAWLKAQQERHLAPLLAILEQSTQAETPAVVRALFIQLADAGGIIARTDLDEALALLDKDQRHLLRKAGFTIGVLDIFHHALLKPGAALWRLALSAVRRDKPMLPLPPAGAVVLALTAREEQMGARQAGFRGFGDAQVRIDMVERIARGGHEAIAKNERYDATSPFIVSLGLSDALFNHIMRNAGFRAVTPKAAPAVAETPAEAPTETLAETPAEEQAEAVASPEDSAAPALGEGAAPSAHETESVGTEPAPVEEASVEASVEPVAPEAVATEARPESAVAEEASPEEAAPAAAAAEVASEEAAVAEGEPAAPAAGEGANWVFRGRHKPRERKAFPARGEGQTPRNAQRGARGKDGEARQGAYKGKDGRKDGQGRDVPREGRGKGGRPGGPKGEGGRGGRGQGGASPYAHRDTERPAGGGAFAGLAALLGREE